MGKQPSRRQYLVMVGTASLVGMAGCSAFGSGAQAGNENGDPDTDEKDGEPTSTAGTKSEPSAPVQTTSPTQPSVTVEGPPTGLTLVDKNVSVAEDRVSVNLTLKNVAQTDLHPELALTVYGPDGEELDPHAGGGGGSGTLAPGETGSYSSMVTSFSTSKTFARVVINISVAGT